MQSNITVSSRAASALQGVLQIPGDKSISHRAIMLAACAQGISTIRGYLNSEDVAATLAIFRALQVPILQSDEQLTITGTLKPAQFQQAFTFDCGNSGTTMRLMSGLLAGLRISATLTGDASLMRRPMRRIVEPLTKMGAEISNHASGTPPIIIASKQILSGISYRLVQASAQVKSALLFAGLFAEGPTTVEEPFATRDHSERMLRDFAAEVLVQKNNQITIFPSQLQATNIQVPGDISAAAFFIVAATLIAGSSLTLRDIGLNPTRTGLLTVLRAMGATIAVQNQRQWGNEPVADLHITASQLQATRVSRAQIPSLIDELPILFIAAACASGTSHFEGVEELKHKESNRLQVMAQALQTFGIAVQYTASSISITGGSLSGGNIDSHGDHRIAMACLIAGAVSEAPITVTHCEAIASSFPRFLECAKGAGLQLDEIH